MNRRHPGTVREALAQAEALVAPVSPRTTRKGKRSGGRGQTEAGFARAVIDLAHLHGWLVAHFRPGMNRRGKWSTAMQGDVGWPDLVCVHPVRRRVFVAELKMPGRKVTAAQETWLAALLAAGIPAYLWTPNEWSDIERVLA